MSNIWTFSPTSEVFLKRCMDITVPVDSNNKWIKRFKKKDEVLDNIVDYNNDNSEANIIESRVSDPKPTEVENTSEIVKEIKDSFLESIEVDPIANVDLIISECLKTPETMTRIAKTLSVNSIEKISNHLLCKTNSNISFQENFYTNFIPTFLKRERCRFTLDLLINAHKIDSEMFGTTLNIILRDLEIQNTLVCDFIHTLTEDDKLKVLNLILLMDLKVEEFQHNLFAIYTLYRESRKNVYLQNCMEKLLCENSEHCMNDKTYGKLLMNFLQEQKHFGAFRQCSLVLKTIENNRTPFKKPCLNIYKDVVLK